MSGVSRSQSRVLKSEGREIRDVFLSHSSLDKTEIVLPFARELERRRITYWLDAEEIQWGESVVLELNKGLRNSQYLVAFITDAFLNSRWAVMELASALHAQISRGQNRILPIVAASSVSLEEFPMLQAIRWLDWSDGTESLVAELEKVIRPESLEVAAPVSQPSGSEQQINRTLIDELTQHEKTHLDNLLGKPEIGYQTQPSLLFELRRLRAVQLIYQRKIDGATVPIEQMKAKSGKWKFSKYFSLTPRGREVALRLRGVTNVGSRKSFKNILWVDDQPENNRWAVQELRSDGMLVIEATSSEQAEFLMKHVDLDLIVTDNFRMEDGQGLEDAGLEILRIARDLGLELPVLVSSSLASDPDFRKRILVEGGIGSSSEAHEVVGQIRNLLLSTSEMVSR